MRGRKGGGRGGGEGREGGGENGGGGEGERGEESQRRWRREAGRGGRMGGGEGRGGEKGRESGGEQLIMMCGAPPGVSDPLGSAVGGAAFHGPLDNMIKSPAVSLLEFRLRT